MSFGDLNRLRGPIACYTVSNYLNFRSTQKWAKIELPGVYFGLSMMDELSFIYVESNPRFKIFTSREALVLDLILWFLFFDIYSFWPSVTLRMTHDASVYWDKVQLNRLKLTLKHSNVLFIIENFFSIY